MPFVPLSECRNCQDQPPNGYWDTTKLSPYGNIDFQQNVHFEIVNGRPVNVTAFRDLHLYWRDDCSLFNHYRCPHCGCYYRHEYHYDSGGGVGPSFELQELVRLHPHDVRSTFAEHQAYSLLTEFEADLKEMVLAAQKDLKSPNAFAKTYAEKFIQECPTQT